MDPKEKKLRWPHVLAVALIASSGLAAELAPLSVPLCGKAPELDGKIDDPAWNQAAKIENLYRINTNAPAPETSLWLTRDNAWLYIAANCKNPQMKHLPQAAKADGDHVNLDDSLEIFIQPTSDQNADYYHFLLSYANVLKEQRCNRQGLRDCGWRAPWRAATQRGADGWTAELALPLFVLARAGRTNILINAGRNLVAVDLDASGAVTKKRVEWSTLRPDNRGGFHDINNFRQIDAPDGLKQDAAVFAPYIAGASVTGTRRVNGKLFYDLKLVLDLATAQTGAVKLKVMEDSGNGEAETFEKSLDLQGHLETELRIPTKDLKPRTIRLVLNGPDGAHPLAARLLGSTDLDSVIAKDKQPFFSKDIVPAARSATYVVAAFDAASRVKAQADFICEGSNDHVVINAAIAQLPSPGGRVHLSAGTFNIGAVAGTHGGISIFRGNVQLTGEGTGTRLILQPGLTDINVIWIYERDGFISNVVVRDLYINGNKAGQTPWVRARSGWAGCNGVKSCGMWGAMGRTPVNVKVENCRIEDCVLMAVMLTGEAVEVLDCYFTGDFGSHVIELLGDSGRIEGCTLRVKDGDKVTFGFATDHSHHFHMVNNKIFIDAGGTIASHPINNWPAKRYGGKSVTNLYHGVISGNMVINNGQTGPVLIDGYMDIVDNNIFRGVPVIIGGPEGGMGVIFHHNILINSSLEINSPLRGDECVISIDGNSFFNSKVLHKDGNVVWGMNPGYAPASGK